MSEDTPQEAAPAPESTPPPAEAAPADVSAPEIMEMIERPGPDYQEYSEDAVEHFERREGT
jgi:hypothetical protein